MKIDGRCHCGNITFEVEADPATVMVCHYTDGQTLYGDKMLAKISKRSCDGIILAVLLCCCLVPELKLQVPNSYVNNCASGKGHLAKHSLKMLFLDCQRGL
jgi:hypothetical protein